MTLLAIPHARCLATRCCAACSALLRSCALLLPLCRAQPAAVSLLLLHCAAARVREIRREFLFLLPLRCSAALLLLLLLLLLLPPAAVCAVKAPPAGGLKALRALPPGSCPSSRARKQRRERYTTHTARDGGRRARGTPYPASGGAATARDSAPARQTRYFPRKGQERAKRHQGIMGALHGSAWARAHRRQEAAATAPRGKGRPGRRE
jgi:hypothetical protein